LATHNNTTNDLVGLQPQKSKLPTNLDDCTQFCKPT